MRIVVLLVFISIIIGCKSKQVSSQKIFTGIKTDTILKGKYSIRPIVISDNKVWYGADKSRIGCINLDDLTKKEVVINNDSLKFEFRSISKTFEAIFVVNIGNPATLYKISKDLQKIEIVYKESHEKVFYDSMQFWNDKEGIALGDPIENCFSIIVTRDGGNSWNKLPCDKLPKLEEGEAAFAASNTNIVVKGNHTWLVSGGKSARVFYSSNKGRSWSVYKTPIVQGEAMTGIFTADFYDSKIGSIAGGDYEKPKQNFSNKAITTNGGKNWTLVSENSGFGYSSCIQFVPKSNGNQLVSVGAEGLFYSSNRGKTWKQFSTDGSLYSIRFLNKSTAIASGKDKIVKIVFF